LSLRSKFALYLVFIHLGLSREGIGVLLWKHRVWLLAAEAFFLLSFLISLRLVRSLFEPIRVIRSGVDFIKTHDFSTRIRPTGQAELDPLIDVYNRMADSLRQERIRSEEQEHFLQRILARVPLRYPGPRPGGKGDPGQSRRRRAAPARIESFAAGA